MKLVRFFHNLKTVDQPSAVAIGSFDGMHKGHQSILNLIKRSAAKNNWQSVVVLFEPQPAEYFSPQVAPARIMRLEDKLRYLTHFGIDKVLCLRFDEKLANLSATQFVEEVLIEKLKVGLLCVGADFRFGTKRQGDIDFLKKNALAHPFQLVTQSDIEEGSIRISSTHIRSLMNQGRVQDAVDLLGHPLTISGKIVHGFKRGRELGWPTINIRLKHKMAFEGVYVVKVHGLGETYNGVANIGCRPTVDGRHYLCETFIFDFFGEVYGKRVSIELIAKIRDEMRFDSVVELQAQIEQDITEAKRILAHG